MKGAEQDDPVVGQPNLRAVSEAGQRTRKPEPARRSAPQVRVPPDLAQRDHDPDARQQAQLLQQERLAPLHLRDRRLVGRRRAAVDRGDVRVG